MSITKTIYIVRHGESERNVAVDFQPLTETAELTARGKEQARIVGERLSHLKFDTLIASTYTRAIQTAQYIAEKTGYPLDKIETHDFLIERRSPSALDGLSKLSDEYKKIAKEDFVSLDAGIRFADSENTEDLLARAKTTLEYLEAHEGNDIVVVAHGIYLRFILAYMLFREKATPDICATLLHSFATENTGITMLQLRDGKWRVITWNDHAHFAE